MIDVYNKKAVEPDWKVSIDDKKDGLTIWQKVTPDGLNAIMATAIINKPMLTCFKLMTNDAYRTQYDATYDEGRVIDRIGDQTWLIYQKSKKISIVAAREFFMCMHYNMVSSFLLMIVLDP